MKMRVELANLNITARSTGTIVHIFSDEKLLKEAEVCFRVAISNEGMSITNKTASQEIKTLHWYNDILKPDSSTTAGAFNFPVIKSTV